MCGSYNQVMEMVERSDEDSRCATVKSVLSEMIASMATEAEKDVFDVEDSLEDLREGLREEEDVPWSPRVADSTSLVVQQEGEEAEGTSTRMHAHTRTHTRTHTQHTHVHRQTDTQSCPCTHILVCDILL